MKYLFPAVLIVVLITSCSPVTERGLQPKAETTLLGFFNALANGKYEEAVNLYSGGYENLIEMNPDLPSPEYAALWKRGCEQNGFACMKVREIVQVQEKGSQFEFTVTFETKDGKLFQFTGCCGETFPEPITQYVILVQANDEGNFKVLSQPPYLP